MTGGVLRPDEQYEGERFADAVFDEVAAGNCLLRDPDFGSARLTRVSFPGCTLTGADFTKATCTDVDLRGASLGITGGLGALGGTTIDSVQLVALAPQLAHHLGITVTD